MSRNAGPISHGSPGVLESSGARRVTTAGKWVAGARPRTLPAAIVPVVVGTAVADAGGPVIWWRSVCALVVALGIQIGTNYANDYSDGVRGTDAEPRRPGQARGGRPRLALGREGGVVGRLRRGRGGRSRARPFHHTLADSRRRRVLRGRVVLLRGVPALWLRRLRGGLRVRLLRPRGGRRHGVCQHRPHNRPGRHGLHTGRLSRHGVVGGEQPP